MHEARPLTTMSSLPPQQLPRLSIVIPSYKRTDLLRLCLASVSRFAPPNTEVIVVDDGSANGAVSRTAAEFPGVLIVRRSRAGGFCVAANCGLDVATAPIVELLNDDAEVTAGWAEAALRWFADEQVAAVAPLVLQNDPAREARGLPPLIDTAGDEYDSGGYAIKRGHGQVWAAAGVPQESPSIERSGEFAHPRVVFGASACAAFYRREVVRQLGGFPEDFRAYFEDVDLAFRIYRAGYSTWFDPSAIVWHRVSSSYGKRPSRRVLEQQSCNEERVFWRNHSHALRLRWLPRHLAVLVGKALRRFDEGTLVPWLTGRARALLG